MAYIKCNDTVLFQGDSITDVGRLTSPDGLGNGYVSVINGMLALNPDAPQIKIINRAVGGDRTAELLARWEKDCEAVKADVLSIKIGVNDVWRLAGEWEGQTYIGPEEYERNYRELIDRAFASGIRQLILCSPTTIEGGKDPRFNSLLFERREIVQKLAASYNALYVPFQEYQLDLIEKRSDIQWTIDGCHPTLSGHVALAHCWVDRCFSLLDN